MYDFIDLTKLTIFVNSFVAVVIVFFAAIKQVTVALDIFKNMDWVMYKLDISLEQYNFLMGLSGILCAFLLGLFIFLVLSKL